MGVAKCFVNLKKVNEILGWKAEHNLDDMCKDFGIDKKVILKDMINFY